MLVIHDPRCAEYGTPMHPENPARAAATAAHLRRRFPGWGWRVPGSVADETLLLAHSRAHLARLERPVDFDPDTPYVPGIADHARRSVAGALEAAAHARAGEGPAFSLMRPPGHHATPDEALGFCYLNQVATAALAARRDLGAARVAVWDFDAHHCNGTEAILLGREGFLLCSVHQSPGYPDTGLRSQANSLNWPLAPGTPRGLHMRALRESLDAVCRFAPDLLVISAGFDAYAGDPITEMALEAEDFAELGRWVAASGLRAAAVLEGGYSEDLPLLVEGFLASWSGGGRGRMRGLTGDAF
jgi:acetoin utilization deacetylase AcuC-like enzyme